MAKIALINRNLKRRETVKSLPHIEMNYLLLLIALRRVMKIGAQPE